MRISLRGHAKNASDDEEEEEEEVPACPPGLDGGRPVAPPFAGVMQSPGTLHPSPFTVHMPHRQGCPLPAASTRMGHGQGMLRIFNVQAR